LQLIKDHKRIIAMKFPSIIILKNLNAGIILNANFLSKSKIVTNVKKQDGKYKKGVLVCLPG